MSVGSDHTTLTLPGRVDEYFSLETHAFGLTSSDGYKALDLYKRASVGLVTRREPALTDREMQRFHDRMRVLGRFSAICDLQSYGIDSDGTCFAVFPVFDGQSVGVGTGGVAEADRRFLQSIRIVDRCHQVGLICGDLTANSFWLDREGNVKFVGVVGLEGVSDGPLLVSRANPESLPYLAPEQQRGQEAVLATDVYALGVLGYYLFTKRFPFPPEGGDGEIPHPSSINPKIPAWVDEVLPRCLTLEPLYRFQSAGQILEAISGAREAATSKASVPVLIETPTTRTANLGVKQIVVSSGKRIGSESMRSPKTVEPKKGISGKPLTLAGYIAGGALIAVGALFGAQIIGGGKGSNLQGNGGGVGDTVVDASNSGAQGDFDKYLQDLIASEDPLAHDELVRKAKDSTKTERRKVVEKAIFDRSRRLGLVRSAEHLRAWFSSLSGDKLPSAYESLLRTIDPSMPLEARATSLKQLYLSHPQVVVRLTAALALDTRDMEGFHDILAPLVGDLTRQADAAKRSTVALILGTPELSSLFAEDVGKLVDSIPDEDVSWLLQQLGQRGDSHTRFVAGVSLNRKLFSPAKNVFLELIKSRPDLPNAVMASLVRGVVGTMTVSDIGAFGTWYDLDADEALFAVAVDAEDPSIAIAAFDTLGSKSITDPSVAGLIEWVRKQYFEERGNFARTIGILALHNKYSDKEIYEALGVFDKYARNRELMKILLQSDTPSILSTVMQKYSKVMDTSTLLGLLRHAEPKVRSEAVVAIKDTNDVGVLKIVIDSYEAETDPDVKKVYEANIGVVRDRSKKE